MKVVRRQVFFQELERRLRRIGPHQKIEILFRNGAPFNQRLHVQNLIPVFAAIEQDLDLLRQLLGLHQGKNLEHLVERAEASRKNDERLRQVRKPELAHEEVVELEVKVVRNVRIRPLLVRKADVQTNRLAACLGGAAIGRFHDAGTAAGGDDKPVVCRVEP